MYKEDLALNNQQWLICHKTKPKFKKKTLGSSTPPSLSLSLITDQSIF